MTKSLYIVQLEDEGYINGVDLGYSVAQVTLYTGKQPTTYWGTTHWTWCLLDNPRLIPRMARREEVSGYQTYEEAAQAIEAWRRSRDS